MVKECLLLFCAVILLAASTQAQTEFGLKAGISFPSYSYGDPEAPSDAKPIRSFYLAGYLDSRIAPGLYLHPEVILQGKGAKIIKSDAAGGADEILQKPCGWIFPSIL